MTSINALRFNEYAGAMVCDEQRGWNDENMKLLVADKIKSVIPDEMTRHLGLIAAYGNTGTSSIGDELRIIIREAIEDDYQEHKNKPRKTLLKRYTMDFLAEVAWNTIVQMKHRHINQQMKARYGFSGADFLRGWYLNDQKEKIEITDSELKKEVFEMMTWDKNGKITQSVFLNSGILVGYAPESGFRLYHLDISNGFYQEVAEIFMAHGSGTMGATPAFAEFTMDRQGEERYNIDPCEGVFAIIDAVNEAKRKNLGVGGYFNIILMDGKSAKLDKKIRQFTDHRAKLATEIVECVHFGYLAKVDSLVLLDSLLFKETDFLTVHQSFEKKLSDPITASRFLRGYKEKRVL